MNKLELMLKKTNQNSITVPKLHIVIEITISNIMLTQKRNTNYYLLLQDSKSWFKINKMILTYIDLISGVTNTNRP